MKIFLSFLFIIFVSGCSLAINEDNDLKTYGITREDASVLIKDTEEQRPTNLPGIKIFGKTVEPQGGPVNPPSQTPAEQKIK